MDTTGRLAWQARATLWGLNEQPAGDVDMPLRFPGQYRDAETGVHYNNRRYYDPQTARDLSPDPYGLATAPNPVAYVSNPHEWTDPGGTPVGHPGPGDQGGIRLPGVQGVESMHTKWQEAESDLLDIYRPSAV